MLHLTIEYFSFVKIDFNVERIADKDRVVLFVVNLKKSVSEDQIRLLGMLKSYFELPFCQRNFGKKQITSSSFRVEIH